MGIKGGFDGFYEFVLSMRENLGVPHKLQELGVTSESIDQLAKLAIEDPTATGNPEELTIENVTDILCESI